MRTAPKGKMIEILKAKEAALWLELAKYDNENAPDDGDRTREIEFDTTDNGHRVRLAAWVEVSCLLDDMGIETEFNSEAFELTHELFLRREAARGVHYDAEGNRVEKEEPAEAPTEETPETEEKPLRVCEHCLMAIESREGTQRALKIYVDEDDETESRCDWCDECGFDVLFEL